MANANMVGVHVPSRRGMGVPQLGHLLLDRFVPRLPARLLACLLDLLAISLARLLAFHPDYPGLVSFQLFFLCADMFTISAPTCARACA